MRERTLGVAQLLRVEHLLKKRVAGLSSGDKQRVALGRAIVRRAKAFLMDEPLGALDAEFRELMCNELKLLHQRINATTVYVTHDQMEAMAMGDRICVMEHGSLIQVDSPLEIYNRPKTKFVASFIGSPAMNFMPAAAAVRAGSSVIRVGDALIDMPRAKETLEASSSMLGVRPEDVILTDAAGGQMTGEIFGIEYVGSKQLVKVDTPVGRLNVWSSNRDRFSYRQNVGLKFDPKRLIVFNGDTGRAIASELMENPS